MAYTRRQFNVCQVFLIVCIQFILFSFYHYFSLPNPVILPTYGLLRNSSSQSSYAIATFLAGNDNKTLEEEYFTSVRVLTYQLLVAEETRNLNKIPFLVLVTSSVPQYQKDRLTRDGAQVVEAEDVPLRWWTKTEVSLWKDQFTKLRLIEMVQYDRILYIDADTFLTRRIDTIFDEAMVKTPTSTEFDKLSEIKADEAPLPANYILAARSDNGRAGGTQHPIPPTNTKAFNAGFWVVAPSRELFQYLMSVMGHYRRFDPHEMEQSLLNYAFRREGGMPWLELDYRWNGNYVNMNDYEAGVAALHEKLWKNGPEELRKLWRTCKTKMDEYHRS